MRVVFYTKCVVEWITRGEVCGILSSGSEGCLGVGLEEDLGWTKAHWFYVYMTVALFVIATLVKAMVGYRVICFLSFFAIYKVQRNLYKEVMVQRP